MKKKHIVILGAGISGLSLAFFLQKKFGDSIKMTILEKNNRVGGWIRTEQKGGFLFELGPHSCKPNGLATLQLLEELQLKDKIILANPSATKRYLFFNQKLHLVPQNPLTILFSPVTRGIISALIKDWKTTANKNADETIYSFISRRFGSEFAEKLIDPLTTGIYAGDIRKLSIRSCFPFLHGYEQKHGSVIKGYFSESKKEESISPFVKSMQTSSLFSFQDGMETIVTALNKKIHSFIKLCADVQTLRFFPNHIEVIAAENVFSADYVVSTLPANALATILAPHDKVAANTLSSIEYASLVVVNIGYQSSVLKKQGFGYLIPSKEGEDLLGVLWDSSIFPQQNRFSNETRLTVMLGGMHKPDIYSMNNSEISSIVLKSVAKHLNIHTPPDVLHIERVTQAIPQYHLGHFEKIAAIEQCLSQLSDRFHCIGTSFNGVSINDCIGNAQKFAQNIKL